MLKCSVLLALMLLISPQSYANGLKLTSRQKTRVVTLVDWNLNRTLANYRRTPAASESSILTKVGTLYIKQKRSTKNIKFSIVRRCNEDFNHNNCPSR